MRVAVLGCGIGIEGVIRSLKESGFFVVGLDSDPLAPGLYSCDLAERVPQTFSSIFLDSLAEICAQERIDVLFPLTDDSIRLLSRHPNRLEQEGVRHLLPPSGPMGIVSDKYLFYQALQDRNLPVGRFMIPTEAKDVISFVMESGLPVCFKRRRGSRGQGFSTADTLDEALDEFRCGPGRILCEYLQGSEFEVEAIFDRGGNLVTASPRKKLEYNLGLGLTLRSMTVDSEELCSLLEDTVGAVGGWVGPCSVELREDSQRHPKVIEMNPRFVSPTYLLTAAGVNLPEIAVRLALGDAPPDIPRHNSARADVYLTRQLGDIVFDRPAF